MITQTELFIYKLKIINIHTLSNKLKMY